MALTHESFAKTARSIPLLRTDHCFRRFHTARVMGGGSAQRTHASALSR